MGFVKSLVRREKGKADPEVVEARRSLMVSLAELRKALQENVDKAVDDAR